MIRFVYHFNYADGVTREEGDAWYLKEHASQARKLPGLVSYLSWPQVDVGIPSPGPGFPTPEDQFVRRSELGFEDLSSALAAVNGAPSLWAASEAEVPGFREFECMYLGEEPEYDLLRDVPPQHYKYMTLSMWWPNGQPVIDEHQEIFIHTYVFAYNEDLELADAEDWYLGHHTREGKQLPGMQHYRTWKSIRVPEVDGAAIHPNKFYRLTELGMSAESYKAVMVNEDSRVRFTPSPFGKVMGNYFNCSTMRRTVDDLLS